MAGLERQIRKTGRLLGSLFFAMMWIGAGWSADTPPNGAAAREIPPLQDKSAAQKLHDSLQNGTLETPNADKTGPAGWDLPDGLTTFWTEEKVDGKTTRVWKIDTAVLEKEFLNRRKAVQEALDTKKPIPAAAAKTPPTPAQQYECVGGTYGVQIYSEPIQVKPGVAYRLRVKIKGPESGKDATGQYFFFPRIFVKGYTVIQERERVAYKAYLACRLEKADTWTICEREIHPTEKTKTVQYLRVMLYFYWPLGTYCIDDIELVELPPAKAPAQEPPAEPAPTPRPAVQGEEAGGEATGQK